MTTTAGKNPVLRFFGTKMTGMAAAFLLSVVVCSVHAQSVSDKPNIIIIYADDLGYGDLSSFGGDIPTPNIDRLGKEGVRFTDFYVAAPVCTPSRFALLTGSYPNRSKHRLQNVLMPDDEGYLDQSEKTLAAYLKDNGYHTGLVGKWHLGSKLESAFPTRHGFDSFYGFKGGCIDFYYHTYGKLGPDWYVKEELRQEEGFATDLLTAHAVRHIEGSAKTGNPFFLFLSYNAPHYGKSDPDSLPPNTVTIAEAKYKEIAVANTLQAPSAYIEKFAHVEDPYRRVYSAMVSNLDDNIGVLLAKLEKDKLLDNTMIWFMSDNGGYSVTHRQHASNGDLRGEKGSVWEGGIRVPAFVMWPKKIRPGQVISTPACNMDVLPTIAAINGFEKELSAHHVDGIDIRSVIFRNKNVERDLFWKFNKKTALRRGDWKLIQGEELYNLKSDRSEKMNLAAQYPGKVKELKARFAKIEATLPTF